MDNPNLLCPQLLEAGCPLDSAVLDTGVTAFIVGCASGKPEIVDTLLAAKCDPFHKMKNGSSALMAAVQVGDGRGRVICCKAKCASSAPFKAKPSHVVGRSLCLGSPPPSPNSLFINDSLPCGFFFDRPFFW